MPPLLVPSSLVTTRPVSGTALLNSRAWFSAFMPVVASSTSSDFVRRAGNLLAHDAMQLLQFLHQVVFGVQAARRIDEQIIRLARLRGGDGVMRDGRGVGAVRAGDHCHFEPLAPEFDLLDGGGAKGVAGRQQSGLSAGLRCNAPAWRPWWFCPCR